MAAPLPHAVHNPDFQKRQLPNELVQAIEVWKDKIPFLKNEKQRELWLKCIRNYIFIDTNHDGVADWTALVDGRPSRILFPNKPNINGDGIPNVLDPNPYVAHKVTQTSGIPEHLKIGGKAGVWQEKLWLDYKVMAVNHTDKHFADELETIYSVFKLDPIRKWKKRDQIFNVIYAFRSHFPKAEAAAFHPTAQAMSLAGKAGYENTELNEKQKCKLVATVLHELGHAFLIENISSQELKDAATKLVGWDFPSWLPTSSIWNPTFFESYSGHQNSFVSNYAKSNAHEWFAETFAARIWEKESLDKQYCPMFPGGAISLGTQGWIDSLIAASE